MTLGYEEVKAEYQALKHNLVQNDLIRLRHFSKNGLDQYQLKYGMAYLAVGNQCYLLPLMKRLLLRPATAATYTLFLSLCLYSLLSNIPLCSLRLYFYVPYVIRIIITPSSLMYYISSLCYILCYPTLHLKLKFT